MRLINSYPIIIILLVTIVTTIQSGAALFVTLFYNHTGYGYMYPVTDEGRGFCIFFALIGIPLFMACLAVYAQHTANFIRWVCKKLRSIMGGQEEENETVR